MPTDRYCKCPRCRRDRRRIYGVVYNWQHNRREMVNRLLNLVQRIRVEVKEGADA